MSISVRNFSLGCSLCEYLAYISQHLHWQCVRRSPGPRSGQALVPSGAEEVPSGTGYASNQGSSGSWRTAAAISGYGNWSQMHIYC